MVSFSLQPPKRLHLYFSSLFNTTVNYCRYFLLLYVCVFFSGFCLYKCFWHRNHSGSVDQSRHLNEHWNPDIWMSTDSSHLNEHWNPDIWLSIEIQSSEWALKSSNLTEHWKGYKKKSAPPATKLGSSPPADIILDILTKICFTRILYILGIGMIF